MSKKYTIDNKQVNVLKEVDGYGFIVKDPFKSTPYLVKEVFDKPVKLVYQQEIDKLKQEISNLKLEKQKYVREKRDGYRNMRYGLTKEGDIFRQLNSFTKRVENYFDNEYKYVLIVSYSTVRVDKIDLEKDLKLKLNVEATFRKGTIYNLNKAIFLDNNNTIKELYKTEEEAKAEGFKYAIENVKNITHWQYSFTTMCEYFGIDYKKHKAYLEYLDKQKKNKEDKKARLLKELESLN